MRSGTEAFTSTGKEIEMLETVQIIKEIKVQRLFLKWKEGK